MKIESICNNIEFAGGEGNSMPVESCIPVIASKD